MRKEGQLIPHIIFVDDDVYVEIFNKLRIFQTVAAGTEALFLLLGESNLTKRQDPILWDKLLKMMIHYRNMILGLILDTRTMTVSPLPEYLDKVIKLLETAWRGDPNGRKSFFVNKVKTLCGQLGHLSGTALWLKFLMAHI